MKRELTIQYEANDGLHFLTVKAKPSYAVPLLLRLASLRAKTGALAAVTNKLRAGTLPIHAGLDGDMAAAVADIVSAYSEHLESNNLEILEKMFPRKEDTADETFFEV